MASQDTLTMLLVGFWLFFPIGFILLLLHQVFTDDDKVSRDFYRFEHDLEEADNVVSLNDHRDKKSKSINKESTDHKSAA
jgi:hypothetical protein